MKAKEKWRSLKKLPMARALQLNIASGGHYNRSNGLCVMEAAAWIAGEAHTDHPACVSPVIGAFLRRWNDDIKDDSARSKIMRPFLRVVIGTAGDDALEAKRARMCDDWMIRVHAPAWLDLAGLKGEAAALRALPEVNDKATLDAAMPALRTAQEKARAARAAAGDAAWAAAGDAAWAAAGDASWAAARAASRAAAWDASWAAARDAAWAAARAAARAAAGEDAAWAAARAAAGDAAWAAARAAAVDAAGKRLAPTVATLRKSASDLVVRMAKLTA